ncbi:MAG: signal peptidase I [Clostridia bacterium]|nr:signal peptidase I [Clostridia bacterium]
MKNNKVLTGAYELASTVVSSVLIMCIIFTFFFKVSTVNGQSMENTLYEGDQLIISAFSKDVKYGDVVIISQPNVYSKVLIKRVIAVGGQTVEFDYKKGTVSVDGEVLEENYIKEEMVISPLINKTYFVPEGKLFVMGDNRNHSADSRDIGVGMIDEDYIIGKVLYRLGDKELFNSDFKELQNG